MTSIYNIDASIRLAMREDAFREAEKRSNEAMKSHLDAGYRLLAEMRKLREDEAKLDAALKPLAPWSERWWNIVARLNIVRRDRLCAADVMKDFAP